MVKLIQNIIQTIIKYYPVIIYFYINLHCKNIMAVEEYVHDNCIIFNLLFSYFYTWYST